MAKTTTYSKSTRQATELILSKPAPDSVVDVIHDSPLWRQQPVWVSAVLISYNQAMCIRDALESVLRQTYPMEIIISDDCSSDDTLMVIRKALVGYGGPHRVTLQVSLRNRGISANQNFAIRLAQGELIVLFEGDDVSEPNRVEALTTEYLAEQRAIAALGSGIRRMDSQGFICGQVTWPRLRGDAQSLVRNEWTVQGCGLAFRRDCFFDIGPIST